MKIEQTRIERFANLREQIKREIELDEALLQEEQVLKDYIMRFNRLDAEYFQVILNTINEDWKILNPQLHQDHSKNLINLEVRYEINQYLHDIRSRYDYNLNDNVNLQKILQDHNYHHNYGQHLDNAITTKYQKMVVDLETSVKSLQTKISKETDLTQKLLKSYKENLIKNPEILKRKEQTLIELLSNSANKSDDQFNQLVTKFKTKRVGFKGVVIATIIIIVLVIFCLIFLLLLLIV